MNTDNVKSQMRKGILEYCTLLILQKEEPMFLILSNRSKKRNSL